MGHAIAHFLIVLGGCTGVFLIMVQLPRLEKKLARKAWRKRMDVGGLSSEAWADLRKPVRIGAYLPDGFRRSLRLVSAASFVKESGISRSAAYVTRPEDHHMAALHTHCTDY
jgi:hypothetical protein